MKMLTKREDTIAAIATPAGNGGIGVVRLSGPKAFTILQALLPNPQASLTWEARKLYFTSLADPHSRETIDTGLVCKMFRPHSYTGEDVVELYGHGGKLVMERLLQCVLAGGARLAEPGEYTFRAYLNGKMDLSQAEAVADVIHASSEAALKGAHRQLQGRLAEQVHKLREKILFLMSRVEATLDFPEEDISFLGLREISAKLDEIRQVQQAWLEKFCVGKSLREGIKVVLLGAPNVGKSSLINQFLGEDRAIVHESPGTTRDVVEGSCLYRGVWMQFFDTAGIRASGDPVEQEGIRRTLKTAATADITLLLIDAGAPATEIHDELKRPTLAVVNKIDLNPNLGLIQELQNNKRFQGVYPISALNGTGVQELKASIFNVLGIDNLLNLEQENWISNTRHRECVEKSLEFLNHASLSLQQRMPLECVAEDLKQAAEHLSQITGGISNEEVLTKIFQDFCVGK